MHQPLGGIGGTASDIKIQAEQMLFIKKRMASLIADHSGQTVEQIEKDSDRDRWFTAEAAREYGLIDFVYSTDADAPGKKGSAKMSDVPSCRRRRPAGTSFRSFASAPPMASGSTTRTRSCSKSASSSWVCRSMMRRPMTSWRSC